MCLKKILKIGKGRLKYELEHTEAEVTNATMTWKSKTEIIKLFIYSLTNFI